MSEVAGGRVRQLTAPAAGGVAVLELRGAAALAALDRLTGGVRVAPGELRLVRLARAAGDDTVAEALDEALLVGLSEARIELHLHGSPALVDEVVGLLEPAATPAPPPTLEERAESLLPGASTELGARILVDQADGALRAALEELADRAPDERAARLAQLAARGRALARLLDPPRVVIVGPVNAGKSTLFNLLDGHERAVVSALPGTTRDAIGAVALVGPWPFVLVDTAGRRVTPASGQGVVERAGQALAERVASAADVRLHVAPRGAPAGDAASVAGATSGVDVRLVTRADERPGGDPGAWPADHVSATAAPALTRTRVEDALLAALALERDPFWRPGEPVPFTPTLVEALEGAVASSRTLAVGRLPDALEALLGRPAADAPMDPGPGAR